MKLIERSKQLAGKLFIPGYNSLNPIRAQDVGSGIDNFGVVREAGEIARQRRLGGAHFTTLDGDPFKVTVRRGVAAVSPEKKYKPGSYDEFHTRRQAETFAQFINDPESVLGKTPS